MMNIINFNMVWENITQIVDMGFFPTYSIFYAGKNHTTVIFNYN